MSRQHYGVYAAKYGSYALLMLLLYVLQETPAFLSIFGIKPLLVVPFALCLAVFEGEFVGALACMAAGLFCDLGGITLFGFNGLVLMVLGVGVGLVVLLWMHPNLKSTMLLGSGAVLIRAVLEYCTCFAIWGEDPSGRYFWTRVLPTAAYTIAVIPLFFLIAGALHRAFEEKLKVS